MKFLIFAIIILFGVATAFPNFWLKIKPIKHKKYEISTKKFCKGLSCPGNQRPRFNFYYRRCSCDCLNFNEMEKCVKDENAMMWDEIKCACVKRRKIVEISEKTKLNFIDKICEGIKNIFN